MARRYEPFRSPPQGQDPEKGSTSAYAIEMPTDQYDPSAPLNPPTSSSSGAPQPGPTHTKPTGPIGHKDTYTFVDFQKHIFDDGDDIIAPGVKYIAKIFAFGLLPCAIPGLIMLIIALVANKDAKIANIALVHWAIYTEIFLITPWIGYLLIKLIPFILKPFFNPGARKYLRFFQNLEVAFALIVWAIACVVTFYPTMHFAETKKPFPSWAISVNSLLGANCVASGLYLGKCVLVQFVGYRYHSTQFRGKKKEIKAKIATIERILIARSSELQAMSKTASREAHDYVIEALEKYSTAKELGSRLYLLLVSPGAPHLTQSDFENIDPTAFSLIDIDANDDVTRDEMEAFVLGICHDRRDLIIGQTDIRATLNAFDWLIICCTLVLDVFVYIAFISNSFRNVFGFGGTLFAGSGFAFALTIQDLMASIIFVFVKHPYDVGDRVIFDNQSYIVTHISLLYSVFTSVVDEKRAQAGNSQLNLKTIDNVSRSETVIEAFKLPIHVKTPAEDLETLRELLLEFLDEHSREYYVSSLRIRLSNFTLEQAIMTVQVRYKVKWTDLERFENLRHKFQQAVIRNCEKVPVSKPAKGPIGAPKEGLPGNAQYQVLIPREEAEKFSQEAWDKVKEGRYRPLAKDLKKAEEKRKREEEEERVRMEATQEEKKDR